MLTAFLNMAICVVRSSWKLTARELSSPAWQVRRTPGQGLRGHTRFKHLIPPSTPPALANGQCSSGGGGGSNSCNSKYDAA